tara:strand:+ start:1172 stop:1585 length:414 start_codon:yes stop_codon:yes gene_type:complete
MEDFNLRGFLLENKLTKNSRLLTESEGQEKFEDIIQAFEDHYGPGAEGEGWEDGDTVPWSIKDDTDPVNETPFSSGGEGYEKGEKHDRFMEWIDWMKAGNTVEDRELQPAEYGEEGLYVSYKLSDDRDKILIGTTYK